MARKKTWRDMSKGQRISVLVSGVMNLALLVAAQRSLAKTPDSDIRGKKAVWRAVAFINFFGPVSYFLFGRKRDAAAPTTVR
ncbi:Phospholipase_D-nuclease N-terminal [Arthrobacter sp. yr096]|uniref:PLDc N-terminal domain-containing protein n=1 Tax=unclassified Arthrobacter TaxID=235627 RepID=UPI0008997CC4|nr:MULTISPECIES: PLDc N-terminal domain-containing protein [unclassified Arthrobacter]SDW02145.1 Phospholipase_D-nuclease N-terminal [Arthrobacter sp. cf158]SEI79147.1 Phospholipase_D-nuclease N-terminal [Arthrobacter sp. yr096]